MGSMTHVVTFKAIVLRVEKKRNLMTFENRESEGTDIPTRAKSNA